MGVEFEMKYRATPRDVDLINKEIGGKGVSIAMETAYYDTEKGALSARKYTLRRRVENGKSVCTLKTPATGIGRNEHEVLCDRIEDAIPELCKLSGLTELQAICEGNLQVVCSARFTRIAKEVEAPGCVVELALDTGVLQGGGREIPLCEVEVEHKSGSAQAMLLYAASLASRYGLIQETRSKFRRALDLAKGD